LRNNAIRARISSYDSPEINWSGQYDMRNHLVAHINCQITPFRFAKNKAGTTLALHGTPLGQGGMAAYRPGRVRGPGRRRFMVWLAPASA
jgi:hypothetical protein